MAIPKKLKNLTLFVDGQGYAGRVETLEPPKLTVKTEEFRGGGFDAPVEIDMGLERLEARLEVAEYDPALFRLFGLIDGNAVAVTLRGALQGDSTEATPLVISLRGAWRELDSGSWRSGENSTLTAMLAVRYYKLEIDSEVLIEIDVENMVRRIDGVDVLAEQRTALGL